VEPPENLSALTPEEAAGLHGEMTKWHFEVATGCFSLTTHLNDGDRELIGMSGLDPERWGRPWYRWAASPRYWRNRIRGLATVEPSTVRGR
jgi:hypothetical protein